MNGRFMWMWNGDAIVHDKYLYRGKVQSSKLKVEGLYFKAIIFRKLKYKNLNIYKIHKNWL